MPDLLTLAEDLDYHTRFDIDLLTQRLQAVTRWVKTHTPPTRHLPIGFFGASTGAAAALRVAAELSDNIHAVVSRGGRPDLAGNQHLAKVIAPTLFLVGGCDEDALDLNRDAYTHLPCTKELSIIAGATHLFEEAGTLEEAARQAAVWFGQHLKG